MDHAKDPLKMKDYLIVTAHPPLTDEVRRMGPKAGEDWRRAQHRSNLRRLAGKIKQKVLRLYGGEIVNDGSGYGVEGNANAFNDMICVKTTAAGLEALKRLPEIGRISETIDFDNLLPAPEGMTNVPPGVCWSRKR
jgi:hypothetical protein